MAPRGLNKGSPVRIRYRRATVMYITALPCAIALGEKAAESTSQETYKFCLEWMDAKLHDGSAERSYGRFLPVCQEVASMKNKNAYSPNVAEWFGAQVEARTNAALKERNRQFATDHARDTDRQLIAYLRQMAVEFGYTPPEAEVIGGEFIAGRFGGWGRAVAAAGLPMSGIAPALRRRKVYKEEYLRQTKLFKEELRSGRDARRAVRQEQAKAAQVEKDAREQRDAAWGEDHRTDSDEALLDYVRSCAAQLGRSPLAREVVGGGYIAGRFGGWPMTLYRAGLPMAQGMKPPTKAQIAAYRAEENQCQPGNAPEA